MTMEKAQPNTQKSSKRLVIAIVVSLCIGLAIGVAGIYGYFRLQNKKDPIVPLTISSQLTFPVLAPSDGTLYSLSDFEYDANEKLLSFTVTGPEATFLITEQPTPDNFTDIPEYFDKLVESLLEYKRFETEIGRVSLTKPKEFNGQQAGVINTKGTLMFARPDKELSDDAWRSFYSKVQIIK